MKKRITEMGDQIDQEAAQQDFDYLRDEDIEHEERASQKLKGRDTEYWPSDAKNGLSYSKMAYVID